MVLRSCPVETLCYLRSLRPPKDRLGGIRLVLSFSLSSRASGRRFSREEARPDIFQPVICCMPEAGPYSRSLSM